MRTVGRNPEILWRRSGDRVALRHRDGDDTYILEGTGALIWLQLAVPATIPDLVVELSRHFELDFHQAGADIGPFLATLIERGVLIARDR